MLSIAGSDGGAENWAIVASLIDTCKLNGVDPQAYMTDALAKIVDGHLASKLDDPRPTDGVAAEHPSAAKPAP